MIKIFHGFRGLARIAANLCIVPSIRNILFRLSGFIIEKDAFINMGVIAVDNYEKGRVCLKQRASIAPNVTFVCSVHPNNSLLKNYKCFLSEGNIVIEEDAWLGTGVVVLPGVVVGRSSIIGANSVVKYNVDSYGIYAGIPAKKIGDVRGKDIV